MQKLTCRLHQIATFSLPFPKATMLAIFDAIVAIWRFDAIMAIWPAEKANVRKGLNLTQTHSQIAWGDKTPELVEDRQ